MSRKELTILFTLAAINFTNIMDFMIMMPLGPQLMRLFDISPKQFGFIVSAYTFSAGFSGILGAFWMDKIDRKKALLLVYSGFIIGTLACAYAPSYLLLLAARTFTGFFGGILGALVLSIVGDSIPTERRATAMSIVMAAFSLASVFGVPFGLYIANIFSWHAPFVLLACISTLVFIAITFFIPAMQGHLQKHSNTNPFRAITDIIENPNQMMALLFMSLLMFGQFTIIPFISPYMVANVGFTEHQLPYIYLFGGLLTIFTSPLIGKLADKKGKALVFKIFAALTILPIIFITNMPHVSVAFVLIVTTLFFVFVSGRMIPSMALITGTTAPQQRGSFMSINSSIQQLAAGLASFIAGYIVYKNAAGELVNYEIVGYIAAASGIVSIFIVGKLKPAKGDIKQTETVETPISVEA